MNGLLRNSFLFFSWFVPVLFFLGGCAAHHSAKPPVLSYSQLGQVFQQRLPFMGYTIQVGAFADPKNAFRLATRLSFLGLPAYYFRGEGNLYRVRFGNYQSYNLAYDSASRLKKEMIIEVFIVVRPESYPAVLYQDTPDRLREHGVAIARQFVGVPYRWGDSSPVLGFDCSGLAMMVYQLIGLDMPRVSRDQFRSGRSVSQGQLRPGDLVFFRTDSSGQASHVGVYLGSDQFIHAPSSGKTVIQSKLSAAYFQKRFLGGRSYL